MNVEVAAKVCNRSEPKIKLNEKDIKKDVTTALQRRLQTICNITVISSVEGMYLYAIHSVIPHITNVEDILCSIFDLESSNSRKSTWNAVICSLQAWSYVYAKASFYDLNLTYFDKYIESFVKIIAQKVIIITKVYFWYFFNHRPNLHELSISFKRSGIVYMLNSYSNFRNLVHGDSSINKNDPKAPCIYPRKKQQSKLLDLIQNLLDHE